jgi:hypothetical protein
VDHAVPFRVAERFARGRPDPWSDEQQAPCHTGRALSQSARGGTAAPWGCDERGLLHTYLPTPAASNRERHPLSPPTTLCPFRRRPAGLDPANADRPMLASKPWSVRSSTCLYGSRRWHTIPSWGLWTRSSCSPLTDSLSSVWRFSWLVRRLRSRIKSGRADVLELEQASPQSPCWPARCNAEVSHPDHLD